MECISELQNHGKYRKVRAAHLITAIRDVHSSDPYEQENTLLCSDQPQTITLQWCETVFSIDSTMCTQSRKFIGSLSWQLESAPALVEPERAHGLQVKGISRGGFGFYDLFEDQTTKQ